MFLVFEENPTPKLCSTCFSFDSALEAIDAQMRLVGIFESKTPFWPILAANNFLVRFQKYLPKQRDRTGGTVCNVSYLHLRISGMCIRVG